MAKFLKMVAKYWKLFLVTGLGNTLLLTAIGVAFGVVGGALLAFMRGAGADKPARPASKTGRLFRTDDKPLLPAESTADGTDAAAAPAKLPAATPLGRLRSAALAFLNWFAGAFSVTYVEVIRGTPILLQLYFFYFVVPDLLSFLELSKFMSVAVALSCNSAAYVSEIIRSGIQAVDRGQAEAARSLGLNSRQTMTRIVLPQAVKNILPSLVNEFASLLKETSLASTFFIGDIMTSYKTVSGATYLVMQPLIFAGIIYFCCTFLLSKAVSRLEKKLREGD